jgi:hypothetical protein
LKSGYTVGIHRGPTEIFWTSTLAGHEVQWGVLTLTDKPSTTESLDIMPTAADTDNTGGSRTGSGGIPLMTGTNDAARARGGLIVLLAALSGAILASLM